VQKNKPTVRILDIGTGSGCIAISLAKYIPNAEVLALDVSDEALKIAKENATGNDVDVDFFQWNILSKKTMGRKFDIIVSNPPYVRQLEKKGILKNVKDFEPGLALFVSNEEPLIFFDGIGQFAKEHLDKEGQLYLEINQYLGKETEQLLKHQNFLEIELRKDMFGNDRMLRGRLD
ncbi:MAG: HemK/PrmC family methyltransferase, partial [Bacteroidota bacterium]